MEIKIFSSDSFRTLENNVNAFMANRSVISVTMINQYNSEWDNNVLVCTVVYE